MSDFASLKKSRSSAISQLDEQLKKMNSSGYQSDADEFWQPEVDKAGNGYAIIRFLPAPAEEDLPFVRLWTHSFQGPTGKWYIENCRTTLGEDDPCSEYASELWNTGIEENKEEVRKKFKRRLTYISNIYVVSDPAKPENNGKVFKFKYGKKIWDKLNDLMNPVQIAGAPEEPRINPFDLWEGANFVLKIRKVEGYRNYDKSEFQAPAPLHEDDAVLETIWKQEYSLAKIVAPDNFKSYDELKKKLYLALGKTAPAGSAGAAAPAREEKEMSFKPSFGESEGSAAKSSAGFGGGDDETDEDESLAFFKKLASD
ncbi:single-stranded DNA binding protein [Sinorhizobium phage phiN3]|uniref:Single-stranded DNA-binding protein n=1 Tax=Sinorhizobium phage phiN3 TaxID=1647405 RepID=A0A0F6YPC9_9CAUD|nr:single strand DNA binding protein [Sinorhizobium phage phiN3]AKF13406.1 single-stranded DNA binding protein [Sinorhizobium phage phiN3]